MRRRYQRKNTSAARFKTAATPFRTVICLLTAFLTFAGCFVRPERAAVSAGDGAVIYAYLPADVTLFSMGADGVYSPVCVLPATYFAALLDSPDLDAEYIRVSYLDITGYVLRREIEPVDYEPVTKYADRALIADNDGSAAVMRESPSHDGGGASALIQNGTRLLCYGTAEGTAWREQLKKEWYYARAGSGENAERGYVYYLQVIAEPVTPNVIEKVAKPPETPDPPAVAPSPPQFTQASSTVIIICLCVPAALIMLFLFYGGNGGGGKRAPRSGK
ncbi:MAG: hypothetical protein LBP26_00715 [Clostridiales bacterium]|jgi:hypothetical protein|nr:hypothetical protein [Clostridiales bacterium]